MTAINFPTSPTVGDFYTSGGKAWQWNGTAWKSYGSELSVGPTGPIGTNGSTGPTGPEQSIGKVIAMSMVFGG